MGEKNKIWFSWGWQLCKTSRENHLETCVLILAGCERVEEGPASLEDAQEEDCSVWLRQGARHQGHDCPQGH